MIMTIQEGSNYFRGLLLLIRKDHTVTEEEIVLMMRVGKSLGFAKSFCETAIRDILENYYILDKPPIFSQMEIAKKFITDGLIIANCDHTIHVNEERWLQLIAEANEIDNGWFLQEQKRILCARENNDMNFDDLNVEHVQ